MNQSKLIEVKDGSTFERQIKTIPFGVLFFYADWHEPCKNLKPVIEQLANDHSINDVLLFFSIEAEEYSDISQLYNIQAVPTILMIEKNREVNRLEAVTAPLLVNNIKKFANQASNTSKILNNKTAISTENNQQQQQQQQQQQNKQEDKIDKEKLNQRLSKLVTLAPVMLFLKGTPENPRCGFSRQMMDILKEHKITFGYFDILNDEEVRQGLKEFSNWPTYPQLYVKGKLVGGLDVVKEMIDDGEFDNIFPKDDVTNLTERLEKLIKEKPIMVFIKGTPQQPACGFSAHLVQILENQGIKNYGSFDILTDMAVREGLKKYSNWPTYPQLYIHGKLIGGLDVVKEMIDDGEFEGLIKDLKE